MPAAPETPRHVSQMTVEEIEAFERAHGISTPWATMQQRRANRQALDAAAIAGRTPPPPVVDARAMTHAEYQAALFRISAGKPI